MQKVPLKIQNLVKYYGNLCAVNKVSFEVQPGEIYGLLGPNGAGKTSIISIITTLEALSSGTVEIFNHPVSARSKEAKILTGSVPQELINHGFFTIEEILRFHSGYFGKYKNQAQIDYLIDKMGLKEQRHKTIKSLSGGMKRRLLIAKALVHKPRLLLLDEPTAGVDVELRNSLWDFVKELRDSGVSILLTTHYLEEAEQLCDRIGILDKGTLKMEGPTKELVNKLTQRNIIFTFRTPAPDLKHSQLIGRKEHELHFRIPASEKLGNLLLSLKEDIGNIKDISIREGSLEDVFQELLGLNGKSNLH